MNNHLAKMIKEVQRRSHHNAARCICVWAALALREEGYGKDRIKRVLENIRKYATLTLSGDINIDEQIQHIANVTGLRIVQREEGEITIEEIEEAEKYDTEEN